MSVALSTVVSMSSGAAAASAKPVSKGERAKALRESGMDKVEKGDFEGALVDLDASLALEVTPKALYARAQALVNTTGCGDAVPVYQQALELIPADADDARETIEEAIFYCADALASGDERAESVPVVIDSERTDSSKETQAEEIDDGGGSETPVAAGKPWYVDPYAPIGVGLGAVGLGLGGYFLVEASNEANRSAQTYEDREQSQERAQSLRVRGGVIIGVGGALFLAGVIRYAVLAARGRRNGVAVAPSVGRRWGGVSVVGRF